MENIKFKIAQTVYLKTDPDQFERVITGINIRPNGVHYAVTFGMDESFHYDFEISESRDVIKTTSY